MEMFLEVTYFFIFLRYVPFFTSDFHPYHEPLNKINIFLSNYYEMIDIIRSFDSRACVIGGESGTVSRGPKGPGGSKGFY